MRQRQPLKQVCLKQLGVPLKATIVCSNKYKGNTMKIALAMASVLDAEVVEPKDAEVSAVVESDLAGFGSGIFFGKHEESLLAFVDTLPNLEKNVFVFSTRGRNSFFEATYHKLLKEKLTQKGYKVIGEYSCRGFTDYYKIFKIFGGVNKVHPTEKEIEKAKAFALRLKKTYNKRSKSS